MKTLFWRPGPVRAFDIETKQWKEFRRPSEAASLKLEGSEAPDPLLHVYDLKSGLWTAIANPGVAAWEPLRRWKPGLSGSSRRW